MKNEWNKWKNHFYEMKGDVGMSWHEKERKQEDAYTNTQTHSQPNPYIFVSFKNKIISCRQIDVNMFFLYPMHSQQESITKM